MRNLSLIVVLAIITSCAPRESTYLSNPNADNSTTTSESKIESVQLKPKVDILFVLDNSGSMSDENKSIKRNISKFVSAFTKNNGVDYQIATTNVYDSKHFTRDSYIKKYGKKQNGILNTTMINGKPTSIITPRNSRYLERIFNVKIYKTPAPGQIPQGPIYEELFSPIVSAMQTNKTFIREGSLFVVILISDAETAEDDISSYDLIKFIEKRSNKNYLTFAAISPSNDQSECFKDVNTKKEVAKDPVKVEEFIENTNGKIFSLCSDKFGEELTNFGIKIKKRLSTRIFELKKIPDMYSLEVTINGEILKPGLEDGWVYDAITKEVKISDAVEFEGTALIEISYKPINTSDFNNKRVVILGQ